MTLQGETISTGALKTCPDCRITVEFEVLHSPAGYYIGTMCNCGPYSRESNYYKTKEQTEQKLASGIWWRD